MQCVAWGLKSWICKMANAVMYMKNTFLLHVYSRIHRQEKLVSKPWTPMFGYSPVSSKRKGKTLLCSSLPVCEGPHLNLCKLISSPIWWVMHRLLEKPSSCTISVEGTVILLFTENKGCHWELIMVSFCFLLLVISLSVVWNVSHELKIISKI